MFLAQLIDQLTTIGDQTLGYMDVIILLLPVGVRVCGIEFNTTTNLTMAIFVAPLIAEMDALIAEWISLQLIPCRLVSVIRMRDKKIIRHQTDRLD